jgi:hypothetical protein
MNFMSTAILISFSIPCDCQVDLKLGWQDGLVNVTHEFGGHETRESDGETWKCCCLDKSTDNTSTLDQMGERVFTQLVGSAVEVAQGQVKAAIEEKVGETGAEILKSTGAETVKTAIADIGARRCVLKATPKKGTSSWLSFVGVKQDGCMVLAGPGHHSYLKTENESCMVNPAEATPSFVPKPANLEL